jgi:hypothetical protein
VRPARIPDRPPTLAHIVGRAAQLVDPSEHDRDIGALEERFEDDDEPVRAVEHLEERLAIALEGVDVEVEKPAVSVAAAVILYLARHPEQIDNDREHLLRLASRAQWHGDPPAAVAGWLDERRIGE